MSALTYILIWLAVICTAVICTFTSFYYHNVLALICAVVLWFFAGRMSSIIE